MKKFNKALVSILIVVALLTSVVSAAVDYRELAASTYKDVEKTDWFAEYVGKLTELNIVNGYNGAFDPSGYMTRAQFVKMLVVAMDYKRTDSVSFDDIKPFPTSKAHWAAVYVETALRNRIIIKEEVGDNFYPDTPLLRRDMAIMMCRALKLELSTGDSPFIDIVEPNNYSGYATKLYEEYLVQGEVISGVRLLNPEAISSRAEVTAIISRMLDYKKDPKAYVEAAAMAERFKNGTQTAEDIAKKRAVEIAKAKADLNYIMEPEIRVLNTLEDFEGFGDDAVDMFDYFAGYLTLDNYDIYKQHTPDCQFKLVCTNGDKDLVNTGTLLTQPFISYDHVYEVRRDLWKPTKDFAGYSKELKAYRIFSVSRNEEKSVNGKWTNVPDYVKAGDTLNFKLYIKRGNNTKEYELKLKVN